MERREVFSTLGALALAGVAAKVSAEHAHHHAGASKHQPLIDAAADCAKTSEACLAHCLVVLGEGDTSIAKCAQSVNQTLALCAALESLAAQKSPYVGKLARLVMDACNDCENECRKHEKHPECKTCAESCVACAKQCKAFAV